MSAARKPRPDYSTPVVRSICNATRVCLAGFALFALGRALAYNPLVPTILQERPPRAVQGLIDAGMPLPVLAAGWMLAVLTLTIAIFRPRIWTTLPLAAMCSLWALAYVISWTAVGGNGYIYILTYTSLIPVILAGGFVAGRALALAIEHDRSTQ